MNTNLQKINQTLNTFPKIWPQYTAAPEVLRLGFNYLKKKTTELTLASLVITPVTNNDKCHLNDFLDNSTADYHYFFEYSDYLYQYTLIFLILFFFAILKLFILIKDAHILNFAIALELVSLYCVVLCLILLLWNQIAMVGTLYTAILVIGAAELCIGLVIYFFFLQNNVILNWNLFKNTRS